MAAPVQVDRAQVLAFRVAAQGLHRDTAALSSLAVLDIGVQEAMGHPAALAFAARLPDGVDPLAAVGPGHRLALAWTLRGAPHVHRRKDLDGVAAAIYPLSEADATARLNETGPSIARKGMTALEQFSTAVDAMRAVVTDAVDKGSASTAVTRRIPAAMWRECRACGTSHISDSAMRVAAPAAGLELEPGTNPPVLLPRAGATLPEGPDAVALARLARAYLALLGPAGPREFAGYLDARRADLARWWPDDLVEVEVEGRAAFLPERSLALLRTPPEPDAVRLLGPFDPFLQARDRDLIVPDKSVQKALWPVLGRPGVLLVDGEVAGTWRTKSSGRRLTITVDAFAPMPPSVWSEVEAEAQRVGQVRGAADVRVVRPG